MSLRGSSKRNRHRWICHCLIELSLDMVMSVYCIFVLNDNRHFWICPCVLDLSLDMLMSVYCFSVLNDFPVCLSYLYCNKVALVPRCSLVPLYCSLSFAPIHDCFNVAKNIKTLFKQCQTVALF